MPASTTATPAALPTNTPKFPQAAGGNQLEGMRQQAAAMQARVDFMDKEQAAIEAAASRETDPVKKRDLDARAAQNKRARTSIFYALGMTRRKIAMTSTIPGEGILCGPKKKQPEQPAQK